MTFELFEQQFGFAGVERAEAGTPVPESHYCCIIPQEDVTISNITLAHADFSSTNWVGKTLAAGIPFYIPFTTVELTGNADCYKTVRNRARQDKLQ
jgi:hypothetical protein